MTILDNIISKISELENTLMKTHFISQEFYEDLLFVEYTNLIHALDTINHTGVWDKILDLQERHDTVEAKLPNVSDTEFEEFVVVGDLLAANLAVV